MGSPSCEDVSELILLEEPCWHSVATSGQSWDSGVWVFLGKHLAPLHFNTIP